MYVRSLIVLLAIAFSGAAYGQPSPQTDRQAIYNVAQAAFDRQDWANAAAGFVNLLPSDASRPLGRSEGVIASRYAEALRRIGNLDQANLWVDRALAALSPNDPIELATTWITKGDIKQLTFEYGDAIKAYDQADALLQNAGPNDLLYSARTGLAFAGVTVDPRHVADRLDALLADPAFRKRASPSVLAEVEDLDARAYMNLGDKTGARRLVERAVADSGGLTTSHVSTAQVTIRADAGIIARLGRDDDATRRYFAYTGAGHLKNMSWVTDHAGELPLCGGAEDEVRPDDSVVVTFLLSEDGTVVGVLPVYASRPGQLGAIFARAVSKWRWNPQSIKAVEPFWRATLQLELRCVTRPRPQQLSQDAWRQATNWLSQRRLITPADLTTGSGGESYRVRSDDPRLTTPGGAILRAVAAPLPRRKEAIELLWKRLDEQNAPPAAYAILIDRWAKAQTGATTVKESWRDVANILTLWLPRFRERFPSDRSLTWLTLENALALEQAGDFAAAQPLLQSLLTSRSPGDNDDPLIMVALLHRAIGLDRAGHTVEARETLAKSGLNGDQCSLFDTHPIAQSMLASAAAFPEEAQRWSFEGTVQEAFDIGDDGRVKDVRTVIAYPPYIFDHATENVVGGFRFVPPRLGGKVVGCEGQMERINFRLTQ